ncbi:MAG: D-alanine--D-alanine ligase [Reinekea sp.]
MSSKIKVGIVFGGRSAEHQVSLQSANSIINAIDRTRYEPVLIGITKNGEWLLNESTACLLNSDNPETIELNNADGQSVTLIAGQNRGEVMPTGSGATMSRIDVLFPVLHGPYGEDGSIQGLAKLANIPCVGSGIIGSALGMDKDFAKRLLKLAGLSVADYVMVRNGELSDALIDQIEQRLGYPAFVKPANMGSSIGVSKINNRDELIAAVLLAAKHDRKVLVEEAISGREIECAVLGNDEPHASICGEIASHHGFYDYTSKYINAEGAELIIPASLSAQQQQRIQQVALQAFMALDCRGLSRVDVFLTPEDDIVVNEINTIPGFTKISMYPKLWEHSGISYSDLIDQLIQLAIDDFSA